MSFEDFIFILAYPILFTGTKALQSRKTKELWQFQKAFSLKTQGWSVSRLRSKILLECLKKLGLLRLAEKAFQWDQHTQRALLYNHFSLSAESIHWSKNLIGFMLAAWYMVCQTPAGKDVGFLSSSSLEKKRIVRARSVSCTGTSSQSKPESDPSTGHGKTVVWSSKVERCSWACYHSAYHFIPYTTE